MSKFKYIDATRIAAAHKILAATCDRSLWRNVPCGNYCLMPGAFDRTEPKR